MLRAVTSSRMGRRNGEPDPGLRVCVLKCGHIIVRSTHKVPVMLECGMCTFQEKERSAGDVKRAAKKERRRIRKLRQQIKVEKLIMAKKKMAPSKVAKKKDLKSKKTKEKGPKTKVGRKLIMVGSHLYGPKGSLLSKILKAFEGATDATMGENEIVIAMEKAGVKAEGKKTVKKLVKGILRNMLRAGVVVKQRDVKKDEALAAFIGEEEDEDEDSDEDGDEDGDDEDGDEDADESSDDDDSEDADEDDDEDEDEKPKAKKKVVKKKK